MKMNVLVSETTEPCESTVIRFGDAELILRENGCHELVGGCRADQIAAREYISFFLHDVVVNSPIRVVPGTGSQATPWTIVPAVRRRRPENGGGHAQGAVAGPTRKSRIQHL